MTAERLTLPGSIPGLLRRGSPVVYSARGREYAATLCEQRRFALGRDEIVYDVHRVGVPPEVSPYDTLDVPPDLDLSDATGRAHAAWWTLQSGRAAYIGSAALIWMLPGVLDEALRTTYWGLLPALFDPALLVHLDRDDERALPDGSRWVDAEALRRVVLHVAGVTP